MDIFLCVNCYGFAIVLSDNHLDSVCLLSHITWPTVCGLSPFIYIYFFLRVGISSKMTKCAVRIFVTKYSFRSSHHIFMKFWQELKQLINLVLNAFLLIANSKHACTAVRERRFLRKGKVSAILFPDLAAVSYTHLRAHETA